MPDAATVQYLASQAPIPSELRTAEWDLVPLEIRERAFFMAGVEEAEILQAFQRESVLIAAGEASESESRLRLREFLDSKGYEPLPGQEGTIKDLRSVQRMNIALRTNRDMARGYGLWKRQQAVLGAFPAWQYKRARIAEEPRDWPTRWNEARARTTEHGATLATDEDSMFCLVNHPLLQDPEFNRFGTPYPPYQFGSGMSVSGVSRRRAVSLGLLPSEEDDSEGHRISQEMLRPRDRGFNEDLSVAPAVRSQALREALSDRLQGFAEWEDDRLIFTDPNGTRQGSPEDIAMTISSPLPVDPESESGDRFPQLQREALDLFSEDAEAFVIDARRNRWDDFGRLTGRILDRKTRDRFLRQLWEDGQLQRAADEAPGWLFEMADSITGLVSGDAWQAALKIPGEQGIAARLSAIANYVKGGLR